jgi:hypothetical protein
MESMPNSKSPHRQKSPIDEARGSTDPSQDQSRPDDSSKRAEAPALLPDEAAPPLPDEAPPDDDGWEPVWDQNANAFYFHNKITGNSQWQNPRVPGSSTAAASDASAAAAAAPGLGSHDRTPRNNSGGREVEAARPKPAGGYNPAIHGDYDPSADYAQADAASDDEESALAALAAAPASAAAPAASGEYAATGAFNRFTGRWQHADLNPEHYNDENKAARQMSAFFDVDSNATSHDGRSLKAERQSKKFSRKEIKAFKEKRREKKEEKRRAWLRD